MKGQEPADSDCPDFARSRPASNVDKLLPCQTLLKCGKELSKSVSEPLPDLLKVLIRAILGKEAGIGERINASDYAGRRVNSQIAGA